MNDIAVAGLVRVISPRQVTPTTTQGVPGLLIHADGLEKVVSVRMNGAESPAWALIRNGELLAEVPRSVAGQTLATLDVVVSDPRPGETMSMVFGLDNDAAGAFGVRRAIQTFVQRLLTRKGSRLLRPGFGTDIHTATQHTDARARNIIQRAVQDALVQCVSETSPQDPADEKILDARVTDVYRDGASMRVGLRLRTGAGIDVVVDQEVRG